MVMAAETLLETNPNPTDEEIKEGLSGNLCRCTGYIPIIEAIKDHVKRRGTEQ
jgi:carbon-monoxide dehydrogenase small subunit